MTRDDFIKAIQSYTKTAGDAMEVAILCEKYIEANTKQYHAKGARSLANLVEKMREAQFNNYANKKALQVKVDNAIKRIKEITDEASQ